ncbi:MAG: N-acyl homoserine lactonase family protein [Solirubrobacteraceae bacterium]
MQVELLELGWMTAAAGLWRVGEEDPKQPVRVPVPAYLIETDRERILIDTGLHPDAAADAAARYGEASTVARFFGLEQKRSLAEQVDLATVTLVVLSHLHFDHAGGLGLVPESVPIVMQRAEWDAGRKRAAIERNFFQPRDYDVEPRRLRLVEGDHDLLGDGSIELLFTPGHTPGHQSVRIGGELILGIDVAHFASVLDDERFPAFGDSREAQSRSAARLRELRDAGFRVQPGHDPEVLTPGPLRV